MTDTTASPVPFLMRMALLPPGVLLSAGLGLFSALALPELMGDSCTFDEGTHVSSGLSYAALQDYRMSIDNPPLAKVFCSIPLLIMDVHLPQDPGIWARADRHGFAYRFLYQEGNDPNQILFWSRLGVLFWALVLVASIYAASREWFGPVGGLLSLLVAASCPTLLSHGHLMTTDVPAAAMGFLALIAFRKVLREERPAISLACGILLGGALTSKHNAVLLVPIFGILAAMHQSARPDGSKAWKKSLLPLGLVAGAAWLTVWGAYGFRFTGAPDPGFAFPWDSLETRDTMVVRTLRTVRSLRLLPDAYLYGIAVVQENTSLGHDAYALGMHSRTGWVWYFPLAFLVKTPEAWLVLFRPFVETRCNYKAPPFSKSIAKCRLYVRCF